VRLRLLPLILLLLAPFGCDSSAPSAESDGEIEVATPVTEANKAWNIGSCTNRRESNHSVIVVDDALEVFRRGDVLYAFSPDGVCAGRSDSFAGNNFALPVWGDDGMTKARDGLRQGEEIVLVMASSRFNKPVRVFATRVDKDWQPLRYTPDGITVIMDMARRSRKSRR
jgi:hypothetical protein